MLKEHQLTRVEAGSASAIQQAIDSLGPGGGRIVLPEIDLVLDRGLELRSNVELVGQGRETCLRKARGRVYPLSGYHNYGMTDVPLQFTEGLEVGMTVCVRDNRHGGFFETFGRVTWIDGTWVGLDQGLHSDYWVAEEPVLITSFPLVYGLDVKNVAVRNLFLDGNRQEQPAGIGACRGAAVYFIQSQGIEVSDVQETSFAGEGLGFQMCADVRIVRCRFERNAGNGFHPGAGSTAALFEDCTAEGNEQAGFFFCVRANHITVRACTFVRNVACGVSVGTRDCYNLVEGCQIDDNKGPGILFRQTPRPVEVHSCRVTGCHIAGNAREHGNGQIDVLGDAHDLVFGGNHIEGMPGLERAGIYLAPATERVWLGNNHLASCFPDVIADAASLAEQELPIDCGLDTVQAVHYRHLSGNGGPGHRCQPERDHPSLQGDCSSYAQDQEGSL
jgi:hypothetical protein